MSSNMDWDDPEIIDWDQREESLIEYNTRQCFPYGCYPRQFCYPRTFCNPRVSCMPLCFPRRICAPRQFCNPKVSCMPLCFPRH